MPRDRLHVSRRTRWLAVPACLAVASLAWAVWSWARVGRAEQLIKRANREMPEILQGAGDILAARAQQKAAAPGPSLPAVQDLIPFIETAAGRCGISRDALSINADPPRPVDARPDLVEEDTRVDFKSVSVRSLVQFLSLLEKSSSSLTVREIMITPLPEAQGWTGHVNVALTRAVRP